MKLRVVSARETAANDRVEERKEVERRWKNIRCFWVSGERERARARTMEDFHQNFKAPRAPLQIPLIKYLSRGGFAIFSDSAALERAK